MARFQTTKKKNSFRNMLLSAVIFAAVLFLFYSGINALSSSSIREQKETLAATLTQSAVHCYALNGYYPESLEQLLRDYHITYDRDRLYIDYQPQGQNLMPEITVLETGK